MKQFIHRFLNNRGFELRRKYNGFSLQNNLGWFTERKFRTVLDVGANDGQYAAFAGRLFPSAKIYSFEPLASCFENLQRMYKDKANVTLLNCALGDKDENVEIHHNAFSPSSSILNMGEEHIKNFPFTATQKSEIIKVKALDNVVEVKNIEKDVLLKIDVQGYELKVLSGGIKFIELFSPFIILEASFSALYENEPSFDEIYSFLRTAGYRFIGVMDQMYSPIDGKILQADVMFEKN